VQVRPLQWLDLATSFSVCGDTSSKYLCQGLFRGHGSKQAAARRFVLPSDTASNVTKNLLCRRPAMSDPKNRYSTFGGLRQVQTIEKTQPKTKTEIYYQWIISFVENYRRQIFWAVLYTLVLFGVFIERAYCKSFTTLLSSSSTCSI